MTQLRSLALVASLLCLPSAASAQTNAFGYELDAAPYGYVTPPGGSALAMQDDSQATFALPWAFPWYAGSYSNVYISDNGALGFTSSFGISFSNSCLPAASTALDIAPFWDDLLPLAGGGSGDVHAWHDVGGDRVIVSWENISAYLTGTSGGTFQVHLHPTGRVEIHWKDTLFGDTFVDHAAAATIGIQDYSGSVGGAAIDPLQFSCFTAGTLQLTAISFSTCDDLDGDGFADEACGGDDCDDALPGINPDAPEVCDNAVDEDCSGAAEVSDSDGDTYVAAICGGDDCNDDNAAINPGVDADGDFYDVCEDCNDTPGIGAYLFPGNPEVCGDGVDQDCSGLDDLPDSDGDGFTAVACGGDDCDDDDATVNPGSDMDGDGFTVCDDDCDDLEADAFPGNPEVCDGGVDNDCDGATDDVDADNDGDNAIPCGGTDCDDSDPAVGANTDADVDGFNACDDCDDGDDTIYPDAPEVCDEVDTDCDGLVDGLDLDVGASVALDEDLEGSDGGFVASAPTGSTSLWQYGVPTSGPNAALVGTKVWATVLNGNYGVNNNTAYLTMPAMPLPAGAPTLIFSYWSDNESTCAWDYTFLQIDAGAGFTNLADGDSCAGGLSDTLGAWQTRSIDLSTWAGQTVTVRFVHTTDTSNTAYPGTYIDELSITVLDDADGDGWVTCGDCDDTDVDINPNQPEVCGDGIDQDCDGIDQTGDIDGDTYIDAACGGDDCDDDDPAVNPSVDVDADGANMCVDCDDDDPANFPGNLETCADGIDQDCDGSDDTGDVDNDGYISTDCIGGDDCDDGNAVVFPGAFDQDADGFEVCSDCYDQGGDTEALVNPDEVEVCDGLDNNCDGDTDNVDDDNDGYEAAACGGEDCDDADPNVHPQADADSDGFHACLDCDDGDAEIYPGHTEICDDSIDQNCNGSDLVGDQDADSFDSEACGGEDCDDGDAAFNPDATDICDGVDLNCDGATVATDADGDGFFDVACGGTDCDDSLQSVHPQATEVCDGIDNDCDGQLLAGGEVDADDDGVPACDDDCDDDDDTIYPGAPELCDAVDNDCDGVVDNGVIRDGDGDGFEREACGGQDCDDGESDAFPGGTEDCSDSVDNDCDGAVDDSDTDCDFTSGGCDCESSVSGAEPTRLALLALLAVVGLRRRRPRQSVTTRNTASPIG